MSLPLDAIMARRACRQCGHWYLHQFFLGLIVAADAAPADLTCAIGCHHDNAHEALRFMGIDPDVVPVERDYAVEFVQRPCVVCGSRYSEFHHWAPQAVFGPDADKYPGDYLCVGCHQGWHQRMSGYRWGRAVASA